MADGAADKNDGLCLTSELKASVMLQSSVKKRSMLDGRAYMMASPADEWLNLVLACLGIAIICYGLLRPLDSEESCKNGQDTHRDRGESIRTISVWLQYVGIFLFMMTNSALIPVSYDLELSLGGDAVSSGLLVSTMYATTFVSFFCARAVMSYSQAFQRVFSTACLFGISAFTFLTAAAASPPASWHLTNATRQSILFASRAILGLLGSGVISRRMMIQAILPSAASLSFNLNMNIAMALGIGTGPLAVGVIDHVLAANDTAARSAMPLRVIAALCFVLASLWWVCTPRTFQSLLDIKRAEDALHTPEAAPPAPQVQHRRHGFHLVVVSICGPPA
jgi:hypothetical protein